MTTKVKICGLKTEAAVNAALAGGADYVGLVFFAASPRSIDPQAAATLADQARARAKVVALLVDPEDALIEAIVKVVAPDMLQLHGEESPERALAIRRQWDLPVIKAVKVASVADARLALNYRAMADMILFDARAPEGADRPGGHGAAFDWSMLAGVKEHVPYMLSGGLTPDNVAEAIRATRATIVDVSSGVESSPGEKDPDLIRRFLQAAKAAKQGA
jgi:phosphoribosylanthranilate isomerase